MVSFAMFGRRRAPPELGNLGTSAKTRPYPHQPFGSDIGQKGKQAATPQLTDLSWGYR